MQTLYILCHMRQSAKMRAALRTSMLTEARLQAVTKLP